MKAFTQEQQEILTAMGQVSISYIGAVHGVVSMLNAQVAAMKALMVTKGVATDVELEEAVKAIEVGAAVDIALSPEISALEERMRRLLGGESPPTPE